ncbi:hypothetical protein SynMEDNS5_01363 [Synechococcus sp. MEDNS5]|nr:hypothetical protein SynMEDNS5_01363 [Synechococcus sp. MEDNS5]
MLKCSAPINTFFELYSNDHFSYSFLFVDILHSVAGVTSCR